MKEEKMRQTEEELMMPEFVSDEDTVQEESAEEIKEDKGVIQERKIIPSNQIEEAEDEEKAGNKKGIKKPLRRNGKAYAGSVHDQGWFTIGSLRRYCLVVLSYLLVLSFLSASCCTVFYVYYFGSDTAEVYDQTAYFKDKIQSKINNTAEAVRYYLEQGETYEDGEMVKIYTSRTEDVQAWKEGRSYTREEGAEFLGISTSLKELAIEDTYPFHMYEEGRFQFWWEQDNLFSRLWEAEYQQPGHDGTQKYISVSGETVKSWMQEVGLHNGGRLQGVPVNCRYVECQYGVSDNKTKVYLCYSKKEDCWYYLTENRDEVKKEKFSMPEQVYFPVHSVMDSTIPETDGNKEETSDGLASAAVYLKNGRLYEAGTEKRQKAGEILGTVPFFPLETILYEAGWGYYYQHSILLYIDRIMDGYLWKISFQTETDSRAEYFELAADNPGWEQAVKTWEYQSTTAASEDSDILSSFASIGKEYGYSMVSLKLALYEEPEQKGVSWLQKKTDRGRVLHELENFMFECGNQHGMKLLVIAILSAVCWMYLMFRLLFSKRIRNEEAGGRKGKGILVLSSFDRIPTEVSVCIAVAAAAALLAALEFIFDVAYYELRERFIVIWLLMILAAATAGYFLAYAGLASFIRRVRSGVLWKEAWIVRGMAWCFGKTGEIFRKLSGFCRKLIDASDAKRKTIFLTGAHILASLMTVSAACLFFFEGVSYGDSEFLILIFLMLGLFTFLQIRLVRYVWRNETGKERILAGIKELAGGNLEYSIEEQGLSGAYLEMAQTLPGLRDGLHKAIQKSLRDERMKTELITNVSHDIKTPLTSIINYVDLLKRANPQGENVEHYLEVLTQKSERLKHLIEDLVEASKASSGTLTMERGKLDLTELMEQAAGEFEEKLASKRLELLIQYPAPPITIFADGRYMFRILENLLQNVYKYAMEGTRVYLDLVLRNAQDAAGQDRKQAADRYAVLTLRNISAAPLNITGEELTERFVRGEESRTTEGSGLGLSIAKDLVKLQGGRFRLKIDGDLFKVELEFPVVEETDFSRADDHL